MAVSCAGFASTPISDSVGIHFVNVVKREPCDWRPEVTHWGSPKSDSVPVAADKPVYFLDTETGSDWVLADFAAAGTPVRTKKTRSPREGLFLCGALRAFWALPGRSSCRFAGLGVDPGLPFPGAGPRYRA
jgi:hypothetical protein